MVIPMSKIIPIFFYLQALWSTLIFPCATQPSLWKYCFNDWDVWLYPEIHRAWDLISEQEIPYQSEQEALQSSDGSN